MTITVNGESLEVQANATVSEVVRRAMGSDPTRGVAVALDGEVLPRASWERTRLRSGQRLEILQAVQGG